MIFVSKIWPSIEEFDFPTKRQILHCLLFLFFSFEQEKPSVPGTSSEIADESPEIDYQMRYIAHDDNVYCKTLTTEKISVSGVCIYESPLCKWLYS